MIIIFLIKIGEDNLDNFEQFTALNVHAKSGLIKSVLSNWT